MTTLTTYHRMDDPQTTETVIILERARESKDRCSQIGCFLRGQVLSYGMLCPHILGVNKTLIKTTVSLHDASSMWSNYLRSQYLWMQWLWVRVSTQGLKETSVLYYWSIVDKKKIQKWYEQQWLSCNTLLHMYLILNFWWAFAGPP